MPRKKQTVYRYTAYRKAPVKRGAKAPWVLLAILIAMAITAVKLAGPHHVAANSKVLASHTASPDSISAMGQQINQTISQNPAVQTSVSIVDLNTNATYNYGLSAPFVAASVGKLITATLFLHQVEAGQRSLTQTIRGTSAQQQLNLMIVQSDNNAWEAFNDLLGHPALAAWGSQLGFKNYDADDNSLPASDVALLLAKLYQHKLLNASHTQLLLGYMKDADYTAYIVSNVPTGVKVYHKAGWLDDRVNDAAIIDNGKNPYVLVIFTKVAGTYNPAVGMQMYKDITAATLGVFTKT